MPEKSPSRSVLIVSMQKIVRPTDGVTNDDEAAQMFIEHQVLLRRARPFAAVSTRPFDADLEARLCEATALAASIPSMASTFAFDLHTTAGLAAAVARNASEATLRGLIAACQTRRPLAAGVLLAREYMLIARSTDRQEIEREAAGTATALLARADWEDPAFWQENMAYVAVLLRINACMNATATTRALLQAALWANPAVLPKVVCGCAQWVEERYSLDMGHLIGWRRRYSEIPTWFPTLAVVAEIGNQFPHVEAADEWHSGRYEDEPSRLAAQILHLALIEPSSCEFPENVLIDLTTVLTAAADPSEAAFFAPSVLGL
jgi:hypothetical protein